MLRVAEAVSAGELRVEGQAEGWFVVEKEDLMAAAWV
jgi:hypothetical protein